MQYEKYVSVDVISEVALIHDFDQSVVRQIMVSVDVISEVALIPIVRGVLDIYTGLSRCHF